MSTKWKELFLYRLPNIKSRIYRLHRKHGRGGAKHMAKATEREETNADHLRGFKLFWYVYVLNTE